MPRGGRRNGSGRPKGAVSEENRLRQEIRRRMVELAHDRADELLSAVMDLAVGTFEVREVNGDQQKVFQQRPNGRAIQWILEQAVGRAPQSQPVLDTPEKISMIQLLFKDVENVEKGLSDD